MGASSSHGILTHMSNKLDALCEDVKEIKQQIRNLSTVSGIGKGGKHLFSVHHAHLSYL